jgi:hypothetical protein
MPLQSQFPSFVIDVEKTGNFGAYMDGWFVIVRCLSMLRGRLELGNLRYTAFWSGKLPLVDLEVNTTYPVNAQG